MRQLPEKRLRAAIVGRDGCTSRRLIDVGVHRRHRTPAPSRAGMRPGTATDSAADAVSLAPPVLDVVVPVHNEEAGLDSTLRRLHEYLAGSFPYSFRITVA